MMRDCIVAGPNARAMKAAALASIIALAGTMPAAVLAQTAATSRAAVPGAAAGASGRDLTAALARLARNPRDVDALIAAGTAALAAGDADASLGFFTRADELAKDNPRVKAGLAGAMVRSENPYDAIPLFEAAERAGAIDGAFVGERGLAYDLVGDNPSAQRYYLDALSHGGNDEITRRLAISYAIVGRRSLAEAALLPQLQRQDPAAWRARAFVMAILGAEDEAISIAYATMPKELAAGISPYLRYMPRLTPAQQAAAANFGHFPRAADIGRDDPRTLRFAVAVPRGAAAGRADSSLIPAGQPLGRGAQVAAAEPAASRERRRRPGSEQAGAASASAAPGARPGVTPPPELLPAQIAVRETPLSERVPPRVPLAAGPAAGGRVAAPLANAPAAAAPVVAAAVPRAALAVPAPQPVPAPTLAPSPAPSPVIVRAPTVAVAAAPRAEPAAAAAVGVRPVPTPGFDLAALPQGSAARAASVPVATAPAPRPASVPVPAPVPVRTPARSLADAFGDLVATTGSSAPAAGAVDIRTITPARTAAPAGAAGARTAPLPGAAVTRGGKPIKPAALPPPPPAHPSRIWVQLGTGRDKAALAFDWRRMARSSAELLRARKPSVAAWGQTNRLLTGPFETEAAATAFLAQARRAGAGGFVWTSPAGQVVDALAVGK